MNSRRKGKDGELEACKLFKRWWPHCKRMFPRQQQGVKYPDIGCPEMNKHLYVEVKRRKRITDGDIGRFFSKMIADWSEYAEMVDDDTSFPILVARGDNEEWFVALHYEYLPPEPLYQIPINYEISSSRYGDIHIAAWTDFAAALDRIYKPKESK